MASNWLNFRCSEARTANLFTRPVMTRRAGIELTAFALRY